MLDKILVPLDGSELSDRILIHVRRLLAREDAAVFLLKVLSDRALKTDRPPADDPELSWDHLRQLRDRLREQGAQAYCDLLVSPDPAREILRFAESVFQPSLIAMSTHSRTGLDRLRRGSVTEKVLQRSRFPVLTAGPSALESQGELAFRRILVPLDGSARSEEILPLVSAFARIYESKLILFNSLPPSQPSPLLPGKTKRLPAEEAGNFLQVMAERLRQDGLDARTHITYGDPVPLIVQAAIQEGADLIALATHGRSGLARLAFGSVAEGILRESPCPVLVQRTVRHAETDPGAAGDKTAPDWL